MLVTYFHLITITFHLGYYSLSLTEQLIVTKYFQVAIRYAAKGMDRICRTAYNDETSDEEYTNRCKDAAAEKRTPARRNGRDGGSMDKASTSSRSSTPAVMVEPIPTAADSEEGSSRRHRKKHHKKHDKKHKKRDSSKKRKRNKKHGKKKSKRQVTTNIYKWNIKDN